MKTTNSTALHDAMHRIPGVPAHDSTPARHGHRNASHGPQPRNTPAAHDRAPRILLEWQNWIARLVRRES